MPVTTTTRPTHQELLDAGFTREAPDRYRGEGFVRYLSAIRNDAEIVFCSEGATGREWVQKFWQGTFPEVYEWYMSSSQDSYQWAHITFWKGEDPIYSA